MKPLSEQDHYEILEISRHARSEEIAQAHKLALATYCDESLAGYSIFGEGDAAAVRERVEIAYRVLSDTEGRRAYDASLTAIDPAPLVPLQDPPPPPSPIPAPVQLPIDQFEEIAEEAGEFDGARLRRSRLRRGLELEEISGVTKINPTYLGFLEEERFDSLPAPVYVRGFVLAYAASVGLDAARVVASYMQRYESFRANSGRRRGRR